MGQEQHYGTLDLIGWSLLVLAAWGCDTPYDVRMDIRAGEEQSVQTLSVADVQKIALPAIQGAEVEYGYYRGAGHRFASDEAGVVSGSEVVGCFPWDRPRAEQIEIPFTCARHGYRTARGTFKLCGFRHRKGGPVQTVLVVMTRERADR